MADRGLTYAVMTLGVSVLLAGGAVAEQTWQGYAPRCQTTELAAQSAMADPCEDQLATFGLTGPQVLSRSHSLDVETTGSIKSDGRSITEGARAPM